MPEDQVPLAIDEFPALFIAAACAEGQTVLTVLLNCVSKNLIVFK
jgi:5-enolpyruvylshikimate-3-phosphate synthase